MRKKESALSLEVHDWLETLKEADLLVGIPTFNNGLTVSFVISQVIKGLTTYFPNCRSVIFISDGQSKDNTLTSVKKIDLPSDIRLIPAIYLGTSGKGTAIKAIFEAATYLNVKSVALVDSDLRSITPEWIKMLIEPILNGTAFVTPFYNRRKYDGTITNFLCFPLTVSLYGKKIRQPIGGDFGISLELIQDLLASPIWDFGDTYRFGIDIFETHTALAKGYGIKQACLGVKNHDPKDPSSQLTSMFRQVVSTMFTCIEQYENIWKNIEGESEVECLGTTGHSAVPEPIEVDYDGTINAFKNNFNDFLSVYETVLSNDLLGKYKNLKKDFDNAILSSDTWAKTVYLFIVKYHKTSKEERIHLIDALRVLWIGRVAVFMKETWDYDRDEAERVLLKDVQAFKKLKNFFIESYFASL
ncbi:MAG: glycosyltransferase [Crenarchaeota archaeon]|nr:glycosyltransferase [Thermoproteota archaeon]